MGVLSRCKEIMSANIDDFLDGLEAKNADKMINQELRKLREQLAAVQNETGSVMANETAAKRRLDEAMAEVKRYEDAAYKALAAGNEADARQLLTTKQAKESVLAGLQQNYDAAHADAEQMRGMYNKLVEDISKCEARADMIKGKVATAKARETMNKVTSSVGSIGSSLSSFDRFEDQANKRLDKANAMAELMKQASPGEDLLAKYASGSPSSVDDELARMKAQLGGQGA